MKNWTRHQWITYIILFILLIFRIELNTVTYIVRGLLHTNSIPASLSWLRVINLTADTFYTIFTVPLIIIVVLRNRDDLQSLNLDKSFVLILIYTGLAVSIGASEIYSKTSIDAIVYTLIIGLPAGIATISFIKNLLSKKYTLNFGDPNPKVWRISFIVIIIFTVWFIGLSNFFDLQKIQQTVTLFFLKTIPNVVYEEIIYRGLLWMFLRNLKWGEPRIFLFTALLFWFSHLDHLLYNPVDFWISMPASSLLFGFLVLRSKSITPSIIVHSLVNGLISIIQ